MGDDRKPTDVSYEPTYFEGAYRDYLKSISDKPLGQFTLDVDDAIRKHPIHLNVPIDVGNGEKVMSDDFDAYVQAHPELQEKEKALLEESQQSVTEQRSSMADELVPSEADDQLPDLDGLRS